MNTNKLDQLSSLSIDRNQEGPPPSHWPLLIGIFFAAIISAGITWWVMQGQVSQARKQVQAAQAQAQAQSQASQKTAIPSASGLVASGYVAARRQATVSAEITGVIQNIMFEEGAKVKKGEILAQLDDTRARFALQQAVAGLESSRRAAQALDAQIIEAKLVHARAETLADKAIGSQSAVTAAAASLASLQAQLRGAKANQNASRAAVASARDLIARHTVRAPFAGVVIAKNAQVGEILSPSSAGGGFTRTGIATLVDMQSLEIEVDVNEGQIGRVTPGQQVEAILDAYQDWRIDARVIAIIPTADRARATIQVRVAFAELDSRVLPDMAAKVTFVEQ